MESKVDNGCAYGNIDGSYEEEHPEDENADELDDQVAFRDKEEPGG